ncbi:hypothetical protein ALQ44_02876 [Pseudomonas syringae pv. pisi]|uniref:Uncharacterized protein n=2 Tax=Pseudomonas syringae TaxID=317 RepID=A0A3M3U3L1_PSESJ|nr:hypothetical protein ALQ44_02876 [Pseudomonas syringae pv. pisi]
MWVDADLGSTGDIQKTAGTSRLEHELSPRVRCPIAPLLKHLADDYKGRVFGRTIGPKEHADILSGMTHPALFMKKTNSAGAHWFDDIFDYDHGHSIAEKYEGWYGKWFVAAQDYFSRLVPKTAAPSLTEAQAFKPSQIVHCDAIGSNHENLG